MEGKAKGHLSALDGLRDKLIGKTH